MADTGPEIPVALVVAVTTYAPGVFDMNTACCVLGVSTPDVTGPESCHFTLRLVEPKTCGCKIAYCPEYSVMLKGTMLMVGASGMTLNDALALAPEPSAATAVK